MICKFDGKNMGDLINVIYKNKKQTKNGVVLQPLALKTKLMMMMMIMMMMMMN